MAEIKVTYVDLNSLKTYQNNPKDHPQKQVHQIADSIKKFGFNNPILIDENDEIIAGHGRYMAAQQLQMETVPVIRLTHLNERQKRAYRLADNKIAENGGWNLELLQMEIKDLEQICAGDLDIRITGFNDAELDQIINLGDTVPADPKANHIPFITEDEIVSVLGDIWQIGPHRIICDNSLEESTFNQLMDGAVADTVLQDPPYNVKINGHVCGSGAIHHKEFAMASDGLSDVLRNKVNDWYATTLYSRLNNKNTGKILVIMQRLHQSDLTGYLLEKQSGFRHITIPMIAEGNEDWTYTDKFGYRHDIARHAGELLHPEREGMNSVAHLRQTVGEYAFAGQYQQRPVPKDGGLVKRSWLHFYNELPQRFKHIFLSWDTASKTGITNAYSACAVFGVGIDNRVYLLAVERGRLEYPALLKRVAELHTQTQQAHGNCPTTTLIEDVSSGTALIQQLRAQHRMTVEPIKPISDKESRLNATTAYIQTGRLCFRIQLAHGGQIFWMNY